MQKNIILTQKNSIIFHDEHCELKYGISRLVCSHGVGRLSLTSTHIHFFPYDTNFSAQIFCISDAKAVNVQNKEKLEWTTGAMVYQINPQAIRTNVYKYMIAIQFLQSKN